LLIAEPEWMVSIVHWITTTPSEALWLGLLFLETPDGLSNLSPDLMYSAPLRHSRLS
jgi:hypothetical protein